MTYKYNKITKLNIVKISDSRKRNLMSPTSKFNLSSNDSPGY